MPDTLRPIDSESPQFAQPLYTPIKRRSFFMYAGATAGATALVLAGCAKDNDPASTTTGPIVLGTGDAGVLNYAYALEQLEAAFYAKVVATPAPDFSATELLYFQDVSKHEAIHRDFLKAAINRDAAGQLLQDLPFDFKDIDFTKRASVLAAAQTFEDVGVSAYNGAGKLFKTAAYLVVAGQIVSVEARHAAIIRDFVSLGTFADTADANALDLARTPTEVLPLVQTYITKTLDFSKVGQ